MKLPKRHAVPPEMNEAILIAETGFTLSELDEIPQRDLERLILYKGVKNIIEYGGTFEA